MGHGWTGAWGQTHHSGETGRTWGWRNGRFPGTRNPDLALASTLSLRHTLYPATGLQPLPSFQSHWRPLDLEVGGKIQGWGPPGTMRPPPPSLDSVCPHFCAVLPVPKGRQENFLLPLPPAGPQPLTQPLDSPSSSAQKERTPFSRPRGHLAATTPAALTAQGLADALSSPNRCLALGPPPRAPPPSRQQCTDT